MRAGEIMAAAVDGGTIGQFLGPSITVGVAVIGALALIIVRLTRQPVEVRDLWAENRALRADLNDVEAKVGILMQERGRQADVNRTVGEGFDATLSYIDRESEREGHPPRFTRSEREAIDRARALRNEVSDWDDGIPTEEQQESEARQLNIRPDHRTERQRP